MKEILKFNCKKKLLKGRVESAIFLKFLEFQPRMTFLLTILNIVGHLKPLLIVIAGYF